MTMINEGPQTGEFFLSDGNGEISREEVILAPTTLALAPGTLLGKIISSGKFKAYSNAASDGSEVAAGILFRGVPISTGDQRGVIISRMAEVIGAKLVGLDTPARADLAALSIIVR